MFKNEDYDNFSASDYYDAVICVPSRASEAVYYLLKHRLSRALRRVYELHGFGLDDHYEDTIDDFFLYLYDHEHRQPFAILDTIREKQAFFGWLVGTYRNFLKNKTKDEIKRKEMMENAKVKVGEEEKPFTDETMARYMSLAIAHADQELPPSKRFLLYRMLLTILDPKLAIPQERVAYTMGMHPVTYRVYVNRLRSRLSADVTRLEAGQTLPLDSAHLLMSNQLFHGFDHLYDSLMPHYEAALKALSCTSEINEIRRGYGPDGILMHENQEYEYHHVVDVRALYHTLKS